MSTLLTMSSVIKFSAQPKNNLPPRDDTQGGELSSMSIKAPQLTRAKKATNEGGEHKEGRGDNTDKNSSGENAKRLMTNRFDQNDCRSCKTRKYIDGSNDPGVSFKSPTNISPEQSFSAVLAHENEHVAREQARATENSREVISQTVKLFSANCPECGVTYTAGGETTTVTKARVNNNKNVVDTRI